MVFKPRNSGTAIGLTECKEGTSFTGTYEGYEVVKIKDKDRFIWRYLGQDGEPFSIWGMAMLDGAMKTVKEGELCRITYKGKNKEKNKHGGHTNVVLVEVDSANEPEGGEIPF